MRSEKRRRLRRRRMRQFMVFMGMLILSFGAVTYNVLSSASSREQLRMINLDIPELAFTAMANVGEWRGDITRTVYLTFDDGPSRNTAAILDILAREGVPATFFFVGSSIQRQDDSAAILSRALTEGHYLGLHSMTHSRYFLYDAANAPQNFMDEMRELQGIIYAMTGHRTRLIRPPFGTMGTFTDAHSAAVLAGGMRVWDWNVDTGDWFSTTSEQIMANIEFSKSLLTRQEQAELVVLLHEGDIVVESLPGIIRHFRNLGYNFAAYDPDNHFQMNLIRHPDL